MKKKNKVKICHDEFLTSYTHERPEPEGEAPTSRPGTKVTLCDMDGKPLEMNFEKAFKEYILFGILETDIEVTPDTIEWFRGQWKSHKELYGKETKTTKDIVEMVGDMIAPDKFKHMTIDKMRTYKKELKKSIETVIDGHEEANKQLKKMLDSLK